MTYSEQGEKAASSPRWSVCQRPVKVLTSEGVQHVRCGTRRKAQCEGCAQIAYRDYKRLLLEGCKELAEIGDCVFFLMTLTAPSFGKVHFVPKKPGQTRRCTCGVYHDAVKDAGLRGVPVEMDSYRYEDVIEWNYHLGKLWNATNVRLSKLLPGMDYVKVAEWQMRGSLHLHVILRISRKEWLAQVASAQAYGRSFEEVIADAVADIAVENRWRWGDKAIDVRQIKTGEDQTKAAHYLAKALQYVTKDVMHDREHSVRPEAREHFERLDTAARDMVCDHCEGGAMACGRLCHRRWGARSSTMSKSRGGKNRRGWCKLRRMDLQAGRRWFAQFMERAELAERHLKEGLTGKGSCSASEQPRSEVMLL